MTVEALGLFPIFPALRAHAAGVKRIPNVAASTRPAHPSVSRARNPIALWTENFDLSHTQRRIIYPYYPTALANYPESPQSDITFVTCHGFVMIVGFGLAI